MSSGLALSGIEDYHFDAGGNRSQSWDMQELEPISPVIKQILIIPLYWIAIFWHALVGVWKSVIYQPLRSVVITVVIYGLTFGVHRVMWGKEALMEEVRPWLSGLVSLAMLAFAMFIYQLLATPAKMHEQERNRATIAEGKLGNLHTKEAEKDEQIKKYKERLDFVISTSPTKALSAEQQEHLRLALVPLAPRTVIIEYLETPDSRARPLADSLLKTFRSAGWRVKLIEGTGENIKRLRGIMIRREVFNPRAEQKAVTDALREVGVDCGSSEDGNADFSDGRIELVIGEL